jgi:hypothetical protein
MILGSSPRVLYVFPIRDSIGKCPQESILMSPPKWFTKIFRNFHIAPYIYTPLGRWHPAYYTIKSNTYIKNTFTET